MEGKEKNDTWSGLNVTEINDILISNKHKQFELLEELKDVFSASPNVSQMLIRGSMAENTYDRLSDIDLVVAFEDKHYIKFINSLNDILTEYFNVLFPGWYDSIVPDLGGLGFVFLIEYKSKIYQVDIYVVPSSLAHKIPKIIPSKLIYHNKNNNFSIKPLENNNFFCKNYYQERSKTEDYFIECIILSFLILKRIKRSQVFLNCSETNLLNSAFKNVVRSVLNPIYIHYGWYKLENLNKTDRGTKWFNYLKELVKNNSLHDNNSLKKVMCKLIEFVKETSPQTLEKFEAPIQYYYFHARFADSNF